LSFEETIRKGELEKEENLKEKRKKLERGKLKLKGKISEKTEKKRQMGE
jgi:hypothetical protein